MEKVLAFIRTTYLWILLLPWVFIFVGAASNQLVSIANNDKFPVMVNEEVASHVPPGGMMDKIHCVMTKDTHLNMLADVFDFNTETDSIGDLSLNFGGWLWSFCPYVWGVLLVKKIYAGSV